MSGLLDLATSIISAQTHRVEVAGQNIANIATPGYKSQIAFAALLRPTGSGSMGHGSARTTGPSTDDATEATDFSMGKLRATDNPLNLALTSKGFFALTTANGTAYTRNGDFRLDANGRLVSADDAAVQGSGGADIVIRSQNWHITSDGTVIEDGQPTSQISVVDFGNESTLTRTTGGRFVTSNAHAQEVENPIIKQGYLEASNVSTATDMINVMEAVRRAESGQKLVLAYDDMFGTALKQLSEGQS